MTTETTYIPSLRIERNLTDFRSDLVNSINRHRKEKISQAGGEEVFYLGLLWLIFFISIYGIYKNYDKYSKAWNESPNIQLKEKFELKTVDSDLLGEDI